MSPDFSKYDATQLRQILGTIDAARFPERVEEIHARLAMLEQAELRSPADSASVGPDRSLDLPILQRVGLVLMIVGALDIALMVYVVSRGNSYASSLNIFALIAGIFLWRGSLRASSMIRWIACSSLPLIFLLPILFFGMQPPGLTFAQIRLYPIASLVSVALPLAYVALMAWVFRELGRPPVLAARAQAGRPLRDMRIPFALGAAGCVFAAVLSAYLMGGKHARHAEELARAQLGAGYRYNTNAMNFVSSSSGTSYNATVAAWNEKEVINVPVHWQE